MKTDKISYLYIGEKEGLGGITLKRYVNYMLYRWADNEEGNCRCGYASEWANRFKNGDEFIMSDLDGRKALKIIDRELGYAK